MANKDLKTRSTISNAVKTELLVQLKNYSKESGVPISRLLDKSNGSYFNYRQNKLCEILGITPKTLRKYLRELEGYNLLERKRVGLNQPDDLLIKTIV